jgi:uncharacterized protein (TIGR03437 family)
MRFVLFFITTFAIAGDFTTSLGDAYPYLISAITADSAGNTYVVGSRIRGSASAVQYGNGTFFPVSYAGSFYPGSDVFVSKLDPNGKLLFTDTFAGKGVDTGLAIALDPSGNIYIAGTTASDDFPLSKALQTQPSPYGSGFILKLSNDGSAILYSTYFGGVLGTTSINALTTDASGNLYLTGGTSATDFPVTSGMPTATPPRYPGNYVSEVVFVAAMAAAGDKILFSGTLGDFNPIGCPATVFGCGSKNVGTGIALDGARNVYFGGNTNGILAATAGAAVSNGLGAFVGKIGANGSGLVYLTFIGTAEEFGNPYIGATQFSSLVVDSAGNPYVAGNTGDPKFPATAGAYQTAFAGGPVDQFGIPKNTDGFVAKLKPDGSGFVWATYIGGSGDDAVNAIAVDPAGNVWASGTTASPTFPNKQGWTQGGDFLVEFNAAGSALSYSALYPTGTIDQAVALDASSLLHLAGLNGFVAGVAPATAPATGIFAFQNAFGGNTTARIAPAEVISIYGPNIGPATAVSATPFNGFYPQTLGGVQVQINGLNMPLLYVSSNQINAVVPMEVPIGARATVRVINGTNLSADYPVSIVASAAQPFPTVLNQDGSVNSQRNPARSKSVVTFYATGWQSSFSGFADGQVATYAQDACLGGCSATVQNVPNSTVVYGGAAPGIVAGVTQFNIQLGSTVATGGAAASVTNSTASLNLIIWVTP